MCSVGLCVRHLENSLDSPGPRPRSGLGPGPRPGVPAPLFLYLQPLSIELEVMLVVESVIEAAAVGKLDNALAFPRRIHVRIGHFSGRAEEVF